MNPFSGMTSDNLNEFLKSKFWYSCLGSFLTLGIPKCLLTDRVHLLDYFLEIVINTSTSTKVKVGLALTIERMIALYFGTHHRQCHHWMTSIGALEVRRQHNPFKSSRHHLFFMRISPLLRGNQAKSLKVTP